MTVCGPKEIEATTMNTPTRNSAVNRPSFMITDILSNAANEKIPLPPLATHNYLEHLKRFSAMEHEYRMQMPTGDPQRAKEFCDSDDEDFHGSDDGAPSSDGSNREYFFRISFYGRVSRMKNV